MHRQTEFPFYEPVVDLKTIRDIINNIPKVYKSQSVFRWHEGEEIKEKFGKQFPCDVKRFGRYLNFLPEEKGLYQNKETGKFHIAILGATSYEWFVTYFGTMCSGNVVVPLDRELSSKELLERMQFADVQILFHDRKFNEFAESAMAHGIVCICLQTIWQMNTPMEKEEAGSDTDKATKGTEKSEADTESEGWSTPLSPDEIAEIIFTSGTTGKSRAVVLTHGNLAADTMHASRCVRLSGTDRMLSVLPIHHALEMTAGIFTPMCSGVTICINESLRQMSRNMKRFSPTVMIVVPLIVETMYKTVWREAEKKGKSAQLRRMMELAGILYACHIDIRRWLFRDLLAQFGGELRMLVGGGAYIEPELIREFAVWGINIVQGYGITECSPIVSCNTDRYKKLESVGKVFPGCEAKIIDGEIWVKGAIVMREYYHDPEATAEVFSDEWFRTGDLGRIDEDGFLYLTGRKKNLIILANGENVSPEELERKLSQIPGVEEVLVSDMGGVIGAEIYAGDNNLRAWNLENPSEDLQEEQEQIRHRIEEEIKKLNLTLPAYQRIAKVVFRNTEFEKTATKKIKRESGQK